MCFEPIIFTTIIHRNFMLNGVYTEEIFICFKT